MQGLAERAITIKLHESVLPFMHPVPSLKLQEKPFTEFERESDTGTIEQWQSWLRGTISINRITSLSWEAYYSLKLEFLSPQLSDVAYSRAVISS